MNNKTECVDKIVAICAIIWFIFIIDACFTWFFSWRLRYLLGTPFIVYATIKLSKDHGLALTKQRHMLFLSVLLLTLFMFVAKFKIVSTPFQYGPLLCILLWRDSALIKTYVYLRNFVIFYSIISILVELLVLTGLWTSLPSITLPAQDNVQENQGEINHFYGLFVIPESPLGISFYRAMGPLREGGHFSIFIGFIYFVENAVFHRRNVWLLLCGLLTLSPNFVFFFLITEFYCAIIYRVFIKTFIGILCFIFVVFATIIFSPSNIQDEIIRVVLERSLEENVSNAESDGFMALLDGRTNSSGLHMYDRFTKSGIINKMIGINKMDEGYVLSDYRYLIYHYGYIGMFLILLCTFKFAYRKDNESSYGYCLFFMALYVILSRAWMFEQVYIWMMMLLAASARSQKKTLSTKSAEKTKKDKLLYYEQTLRPLLV